MNETKKPLLLAVVVFLVAMTIGIYLISVIEKDKRDELKKDLTEIAAGTTLSFRGNLDHLLSATASLATFIKRERGTPTAFPALARDTMRTYEGVKNLQLAPGGIVRQIYPLKGNEKAIGHNLLTDPKRRTEALRAIKTRELTLAGPVRLIQGGDAVIGRLPVFIRESDDEKEAFWGFTIVLIDMTDLLAAANLDQLETNGYDFKMWRRDPDSGRPHVFARSRADVSRDTINYSFKVPNAVWHLTLAKRGGSYESIGVILEGLTVLLLSFLFGFVTYRTLARSAELALAVSQRTSELEESCLSLEMENLRRQRAKELSDAINRINSIAVMAETDFEGVMSGVAREAAEAIGCENALIALRESDAWIIKHVYEYPQTLIGQSLKDVESPEMTVALLSKLPVVISDAMTDERVDRAVMERLGIKSLIVLPLVVRDEVMGVLAFYYHTSPATFSEDEIDFAHKLASALSLAIENHRLYVEQGQILRTLQEALLAVPESVRGLDFGHFYRSSTEKAGVGGDFYEIFPIEDKVVGILLGDVSGHGIEAANLAALAKNTVRAFSSHDRSPARVIKRTSEVVRKATGPAVFVTAFFAVLDIDLGVMTYCNAGHPPALLRRADKVIKLEANSGIIGAIRELDFTDTRVKLAADDICLAYTDGVIEARKGKEWFTEERLIDLLQELKHVSVRDLPAAVGARVEEFSLGVLNDDIAVLAFKLNK